MDEGCARAKDVLDRLAANINTVMEGQQRAIRLLLAAFSAGGHVLLEDVPGTGKTTMAKALSRSCDAAFQRVQFTPDLLPSDILGVSIYDQGSAKFRFEQGPIFTNILLADEINRASPRTQSALLEAMAEGQVSVEGERKPLHDLFFVIATQNPVEFHGTYPLPEAQMDRFAMRFSLGYVRPEEEVAVLTAQGERHPLEDVSPCASLEDVTHVLRQVRKIRISEELKRYIVDVASATRGWEGVKLGAGPRASLALMGCAQAVSLMDGLEFVTVEAVQEVALPVVAHRIVLDPQAKFSGRTTEGIVEEALGTIKVPS